MGTITPKVGTILTELPWQGATMLTHTGALLPFANKIKIAFIHGSVARGGETVKSDIGKSVTLD